MSDYTHTLAEWGVEKMNKSRNYSDSEKGVLIYGMELILNSVLKACIYIVAGAMCHRMKEALTVIFLFGLIRKYSGGIHANTDVGCFFLTGSLIFGAIFLSNIYEVSIEIYFIMAIGANMIYFFNAPKDDYFEREENWCEKEKSKLVTLIIVNIALSLGAVFSTHWRTIIIFTVIGQGILLLGGERDEKKTMELY